ncbi:sensor histidine kinase [Altericroceibacterium spongiae]|uniref:Sensor histidine kinase n=1 Tax=Altericroceibacterium spongiae TaxID=2320269 RepID=A0A420ECA9_9SPHN|nr:HAMP domain-containing histidine kinase [Altericroceibacterium spongiae]RKF18294.1 sensor histidine kinase [Altericroceibacterium spongiae]
MQNSATPLLIAVATIFLLSFFVLVPVMRLVRRNACKWEAIAQHAEHIAGLAKTSAPGDPTIRTSRSLMLIEQDKALRERLLTKADKRADQMDAARDTAQDTAQRRLRLMSEIYEELHIPLSGITEMLDQMRQETRKVARDRNIDQLELTTRHLLRLLEDARLHAQLEGETLEVLHRPFSLFPLLETVIARTGPLADRRGMSLATSNRSYHTLCGDQARIEKILQTLLECMIQYSGRENIVLRCKPVDQYLPGNILIIQFSIEGTGGLVGPNRSHLLSYSLKETGQTDPSLRGTRLLLSLSGNLAQVLGGRIDVETSTTGDRALVLELPLEILPEDSQIDIP